MFELGYKNTVGEWKKFAAYARFEDALNDARKTLGLDVWMIYLCTPQAETMLACSKGA